MHGGFSSDDNKKKDQVDTASIREKVKLARSEKWRILKNIVTVSFAFMVQFTAFQVSSSSFLSESEERDCLGFNRLIQQFSKGNSQLAVINKRQRLAGNNFSRCNLWSSRGILHLPADTDHSKVDR